VRYNKPVETKKFSRLERHGKRESSSLIKDGENLIGARVLLFALKLIAIHNWVKFS